MKVTRHGEMACIEVTDTGCGIAAANLPKVLAQGFSTKAHGHGFGLHSAATAAIELGGRLSAARDGEGRGVTFTLQLPLGDLPVVHSSQ